VCIKHELSTDPAFLQKQSHKQLFFTSTLTLLLKPKSKLQLYFLYILPHKPESVISYASLNKPEKYTQRCHMAEKRAMHHLYTICTVHILNTFTKSMLFKFSNMSVCNMGLTIAGCSSQCHDLQRHYDKLLLIDNTSVHITHLNVSMFHRTQLSVWHTQLKASEWEPSKNTFVKFRKTAKALDIFSRYIFIILFRWMESKYFFWLGMMCSFIASQWEMNSI